MSDTIDENADVTPSEDPADATPEDSRASDGSTNAAPGGEAPAGEALTGAPPPADEAPVPPLDEQVPVTPPLAEEPAAAQPTAGGAPAMVQAPMTVPPQQNWVRKRWVPIVGAAAAAIVLLLGGAAIGSALDGQDDRHGLAASGDRSQLRQDGAGRGGWMDGRGHMDDRGAQMAPRGGGGLSPGCDDCDDDDCPQLDAPQTPATP